MPIPRLSAGDLELVLSGWPDTRFVSLCNALIWAYAAGTGTSIEPTFAEREKAKDLGVDSELLVTAGSELKVGPLLVPGWNVFQYKRRDVVSGRSKAVQQLKRELKGQVAEVARRASRWPSCYTLFTNLHLSRTQSLALRQAILEGPPSEPSCIKVCGAAEIGAMLADLPHVRAAFFGLPRFETWQAAWDRMSQVKLGRAHVELTGRDQELCTLRRLLDNRAVRAILVYGPHDIGKDRLILEATRDRQHEVLVSPDAEGPDRTEIEEISSGARETILIVEDLAWEGVPELVPQFLARDRAKLVCSVPTVVSASLPNYGLDERVQMLPVGPLDDRDSEELLKRAGGRFDYALTSWIVARAGGIPGVLLLAASLGPKLQQATGDFFAVVGRAFKERVADELGSGALETLKVLSMLSRVAEGEVDQLAQLLGWDPSKVRDAIGDLLTAGVLLKRTVFYEVNPPIFAQFLASEVVAGDAPRLYHLVATLETAARIRLFRRLAELPTETLGQFWRELLGPEGPYKDHSSLAGAAHLLPILAEAAPVETLAALERVLKPISLEERKGVADRNRRSVVRALDSLLLRAATAAGAARLLLLLAEAENETWANNATGLFKEFFIPFHPQVAARLDERAAVLVQALAEGTETQRLVAVEAARRSLPYHGSVTLRRSAGFVPPERYVPTYPEIRNYAEGLLDLLIRAGSDHSDRVAAASRRALPGVAERVFRVQPKKAIFGFQRCLDWLREDASGLTPSDLVEPLERLLEDQPTPGEEHAGYLAEARRILAEVGQLGFSQQVKRWVADTTLDRWEQTQQQLRNLARQAVGQPELLTADLLMWLLDFARGWLFFLFLGQEDPDRRLLPMMERLATDNQRARAFGSYCAAWARVDRGQLTAYLEEIEQRPLAAEALLHAANALPGHPSSLHILHTLLTEQRLAPPQVAEVLMSGGWMQVLEQQPFVNLLGEIAGPSLEHAWLAIYLTSAWLDSGRPLEGELQEFAWRCLEANAPSAVEPFFYTYWWRRDQLAGRLAAADPERGFRLLARLLSAEQTGDWDLLLDHTRLKLWRSLRQADRTRALATVFGEDSKCLMFGSMHKGAIDQQEDASLLITIASQSEKSAVRVARALDFDQPGFWEVALPIAASYRGNEAVEEELVAAVLSFGWRESPGRVLEKRREQVEHVLKDASTLSDARPWLGRLEAALKRDAGRETIWEYDLDLRDLKRLVADRASPERVWAIGRILKYARWGDVQKLLTPEDIQEALPLVELPEAQKRALETALEYWLRRA